MSDDRLDFAPVWIGTSWKMNKTIGETREYMIGLVASPQPAGVQVFVLPPHTALASARDCLPPESSILLGAQNAHWGRDGAGTGEISMRMVKDAGATVVEMGHSERRQQFGETDATVALKARAAVDHGLVPLICVGEPLDVRESGHAEEYVTAQVRAATELLTTQEVGGLLVAYEPIWAIGTAGRAASAADVEPVMTVLDAVLGERSAGSGCRALLYGGGVDSGNAAALLREPHTRGLFVGRAAWTVTGFLELLQIASSHAAGVKT